MKAKKFDHEFNEGENNVTGDLDLSRARRSPRKQRKVNVNFPIWMIESLDREAGRLGVTRQSVIKMWLEERLERSKAGKTPGNG